MEKDMTIDCWDFMKCPIERKDSCPAFVNNRGKECWISTGTLCGGIKQGSASEKWKNAMHATSTK